VFSSTTSAVSLDFALLVHISQRPRYLLNIRSIKKLAFYPDIILKFPSEYEKVFYRIVFFGISPDFVHLSLWLEQKWNTVGMILTGETRNTGRQTYPNATLSINISDLERPVIEPGRPRWQTGDEPPLPRPPGKTTTLQHFVELQVRRRREL